jgi:hypothetical protein
MAHEQMMPIAAAVAAEAANSLVFRRIYDDAQSSQSCNKRLAGLWSGKKQQHRTRQ